MKLKLSKLRYIETRSDYTFIHHIEFGNIDFGAYIRKDALDIAKHSNCLPK